MGANASTSQHQQAFSTPTSHQHLKHLSQAETASLTSSHNGSSSSSASQVASSIDVPINSIGLMLPSKDTKLKKLKQRIKTRLKKGSNNHGQVFRDFANFISIRDLAQLFEEYKATLFLKELSLHAESARPIASTIRNDLSELYDFKYNSDLTLVYKGVDFAVHKAIVCARCPYFRELLGKKVTGSVVTVNLEIKGLRVQLFRDLLKYLYTGELAGSYDAHSNSSSYQALIRISQECGVPNPLSHDLKYLLDTGIYSDASLCFQNASNECNSSSTESGQPRPSAGGGTKKCTCFEHSESFSCHQAILAARSPFFRNVILRQQRRNTTLKQDSLNQRIKIVLDESIIPRRFARILLHVMYRDAEDLMNLVQGCVCKCSAASGMSTTNSSTLTSKDSFQQCLVREIMDLYEIARFLEIDYLVQSCEDLLIDLLSLETVIAILKWSEQSHGSPWVKRQALSFLKEEFTAVAASSTILCQLEYSHLLEALRSDFLEASELDILKAVFKWGEHTLTKQMEERECPNLLLSHSLTRKSIRKKELDDGKLSELISELLALVRIGHILPIDSEYLSGIAKRGFIDTLPPYMVADDNSLPINRGLTAWFRNRSNGPFHRPRFFTPYFEECKLILEERLGHCIPSDDSLDSITALLSKRCPLPPSLSFAGAIPDALYMVDKANFPSGSGAGGAASVVSDGDLVSPVDNFHFCFTSTSSSSSVICYDEADKPRPNLPHLEERILLMMRQREQELKTSPFCARALKVAHNRCQALRLIQLRVVREFGLPDIACDVLHLNPRNVSTQRQSQQHQQAQQQSMVRPEDQDEDDTATTVSGYNRRRPRQPSPCDMNMPPPPPRPLATSGFLPSSHTQPCDHRVDPFSLFSELKLETSSRYELESQVGIALFPNCNQLFLTDHFSTYFSQFSSTESHRTLSEMIPDIAIASSTLSNLDLTNSC